MGGFFSSLANGFSDLWHNITAALWDSVVVVGGTFIAASLVNNYLGSPALAPMTFWNVGLIGVLAFALLHMFTGVIVNSAYDFFSFATRK